jgi:membrane protease YdiL (CAAX protease family)
MARKLVLLLDGTGNEIGANLSNVLKFYRMLEQDEDQLVYYDPGVGTIGTPGWWNRLKVAFREVLGLALGYGLDKNVLGAYSWLCRNWREGDCVYLHGFSRGAYTARVLAGFIHMCGLLRLDQLNLAGYALVAYKRSADSGDLEIGFNFGRIAGARRPRIRLVGVWDTVSSLITPRPDRFYLPSLQKLPYTRNNPSVETFRHAIAMDERRRMFRLNHWHDPKGSQPDPVSGAVRTRQTWFAGVHSDVGGGYPESQSALSKYPLLWMIAEARALPEGEALRFDQRLVDWLGRGIRPDDGDPAYPYVAPDPKGELHKSLTGGWWLLEPLPKSARLKEWPRRRAFLGFYLPWAEPRPIPNRVWRGQPPDDPFAIHSSAVARIAEVGAYRPVNLPAEFAIDTVEGPPAPAIPTPPYRPEGALARLRRLLTTWPGGQGWARLGREAAWLVPALALFAWLGGFLDWHPALTPGLALVALIAFFVPALGEEVVFRGLLLKPPSDGASALGPAALSATLFTLWHPLQVLVCQWTLVGRCPLPWSWLGFCPWFLLACFALGLACARLVLATRSLWPAVVLHWLVVVAWAALFGGPGSGA